MTMTQDELMLRRWHIIDDDGSREVLIDPETGRVQSGVKVTCSNHPDWPPFTQLAVRAPVDAVTDALCRVADDFERHCERLGSLPEEHEHGVHVAHREGITLLSEPGIAFEKRFVTAAASEAITEYLGRDGIHFGHDPTSETLYVTEFEDGEPDFTWCDSARPGPSFALDFQEDGHCTEEDPRPFALRHVDRPEDASHLDRRAFVASRLERLGIDTLDPTFEAFETVVAFKLKASSSRAEIS
jgi:hypothetical protein